MAPLGHGRGLLYSSRCNCTWRRRVTLMKSTQTALLSIARHRGASLAAVATLAFMLSALTVFVLIASGLGNAASGLASKANLIADLNPNVSAGQKAGLERGITDTWPQAKLTYISRQQALAQFRQTFAGNTAMLSALQGNPLPASIQIRDSNPLVLNQISARLSADPRVQRVIFNPNLTHRLVEITTAVTIGGIAVVLGLAFLALMIVVNTTHLTVEARKEEIEVMRLIGATHAFVRNPLLAEGVLLGIAGAVLAACLGIGVFLPVTKGVLGGSSGFGALLPISTGLSFLVFLAGIVMLVGAGIGAFGSYLSVRRFARI